MFLNYWKFLLHMTIFKAERQSRVLGLNSYEVKIWAALLSRGVSTAGELSDIANVPRSRSYDVLESLEKKGFVVVKSRKPMKYFAVSPFEAIERAKKRVRENAIVELKKLSNLKSKGIIDELSTLHTQCVEPADLSGSLRGRHNLYNHLGQMIKKARKNILISASTDEFINLTKNFKPLFKKLKKKNINIKILTQTNKEIKKYINEIQNFAEVRHTENKARFCIVDGKEIIFMVLGDNEVHPTYDVGIWVNTPFVKDLEKFLK